MQLVDEIIEGAVGITTPIAVLLRKCVLLAHQLKNERLRTWADAELDGYEPAGEVPEYRRCRAIAKGYFSGPAGASINNQPIPPAALKAEHRHFADEISSSKKLRLMSTNHRERRVRR